MNDLSVSVAEAKRASVDTGTGCQPFIMPHLALSLPHRMPPGKYQSLKDQTPKKPLWVNCSQSKYSLTLSAVSFSLRLLVKCLDQTRDKEKCISNIDDDVYRILPLC